MFLYILLYMCIVRSKDYASNDVSYSQCVNRYRYICYFRIPNTHHINPGSATSSYQDKDWEARWAQSHLARSAIIVSSMLWISSPHISMVRRHGTKSVCSEQHRKIYPAHRSISLSLSVNVSYTDSGVEITSRIGRSNLFQRSRISKANHTITCPLKSIGCTAPTTICNQCRCVTTVYHWLGSVRYGVHHFPHHVHPDLIDWSIDRSS